MYVALYFVGDFAPYFHFILAMSENMLAFIYNRMLLEVQNRFRVYCASIFAYLF